MSGVVKIGSPEYEALSPKAQACWDQFHAEQVFWRGPYERIVHYLHCEGKLILAEAEAAKLREENARLRHALALHTDFRVVDLPHGQRAQQVGSPGVSGGRGDAGHDRPCAYAL